MKKIFLKESWYMKGEKDQNVYPATVPCSVLSCLIEAGEIADPFVGTNEYEVRDLFWKDYEFETKFIIEKEQFDEDHIDLIFYGLDTLTEIYLNGTMIGNTSNMHRTYRMPAKEYLAEGENSLKILFHSPLQYIKDYQYEEGKEITFVNTGTIPGSQLLRKAHSMLGWDWGAQLPDAGIFRDIELVAYSSPLIDEVMFHQEHELGNVRIQTTVLLGNTRGMGAGKPYFITVRIEDPDGNKLSEEVHEVSGETTIFTNTIENPLLWWPNGYGEQPLYVVTCQLNDEHIKLEEKNFKIGLRTLTVSRQKDEWGSEFAFEVNGIKIFTKGANYIPEDCVYPHIDQKRLDHLTDSAIRANYNCLRIWGGGYYPSDEFYDLCDKKGLIIWQDFMFACNAYDVTEEFADNVTAEVIDNVRRLRHHACLGLWCGNNEIESAWVNWDGFKKEKPALKADYIKLFEYIIPNALKEAKTDAFFWPSSPSSGGNFDNPDDENQGDTHYWAVWHGLLPFSDYRKHYFRFCSEFGFQSFPSIKTVNYYTEEGDQNIFSEVMESHQKNNAANGKMLYYLSESFCYPKDFTSLLYATQILQATAIKYGVEHFRRNRGRCMGSLYWQINDNWPVASWSGIDYFGRWKALHYFAKRFYAHIAGSLLVEGNKAEVWVQNETRDFVTIKATLTLKNLMFSELDQIEAELEIEPLTAVKIMQRDYEEIFNSNLKNTVFCEMAITYPNGNKITEAETFVPYKHIKLPNPEIEVQVAEVKDAYEIALKSQSFAPFVELDFTQADAIFEDNYFCITGAEPVKIRLEKSDIWNIDELNAEKIKSILSVRSLRDTYEA